jgi:hypothetical protein
VNILIGSESSHDQPNHNVVLQLDTSAKRNLICSRVVTGLLLEALPATHDGGRTTTRVFGTRFESSGVMNISWSLQTTPEESYTLECHVVQDDKAPFDLIAGKAYIESHAELQEFVTA